MNIHNALNSYGINGTEPQSPSLDEALFKNAGKVSGTSKSDFSKSMEDAFSSSETIKDSAKTSELYRKKNAQEQITAEEDNRTEAEKNQDRLDNVSDRMSSSDMEELINEGFDVFAMTAEQLEAALERIKLQKDLQAASIEAQVENKQEDRRAIIAMAVKVLGGNPMAERIAEKLLKANLPVTEGNLQKIAASLDAMGSETSLSKSEVEYMVRNKMAPTPENIAEARIGAKNYSKPDKVLTDEAWAQLEPTVNNMLFQAGLRSGKQMMEAAKDFIRKDIPLTAENLQSYSKISAIRISVEETLTRSVDAISVGRNPMQMNLLSSTDKQVRQIIKNNDNVTDKGIELAVATKAARTGVLNPDKIELSLGDLHEAEEALASPSPEVSRTLESYRSAGLGNGAAIRARRQLEEIKAKMTFEAGYRLAKEGVKIDAVAMNKLIEGLRSLENRYYSSFFTEAGMAPGSYTQADVDLLKDTTEKLADIENMPATLVYDTVNSASSITINELHEEGSLEQQRAFGKYAHTLETVMTAPEGKYGDSIEKAFKNVDSLLTQAGIPVTEESRRATRILGYASAEINAENISKVTEYDAKLQDVFSNLHPAVTVRMIRDGINPLNSTLDELNNKIREIKENEGITSDDTFSTFLVNLDKKGELSASERDAYIAIYKALHQIQDSEEAAVGNVFKSGQEPTLHGLLTAVRSGKFAGSDALIDDTFKNVSKLATDVDRIENKIRAGLGKSTGPEAEALNKVVERADNVMKELTEDVHITAEDWVLNIRDLAATSENATRFLEDFNVLTTMENIEAAKDMLSGKNEIYHSYKKYKTMATGESGILPDLTESLNSAEEMQAAYKAFADEVKGIKTALQRSPEMTKLDVRALKKMDVGARFMNRLSKREFYTIPVDTGDEIINMNVTILNNEEQQSSKVLVSVPTLHLGTIRAEASIEENKMKCFISGDSNDGVRELSEKQLNLFAELAQNGIRIGSIYYGTEEVPAERYAYKTNGAYQDVPEGDGQGSPNELYRIAKVFVTHVRQADLG
ncbi:MAG: DUF6240 domain-containing protein [Lachnospiraceae bacterium]|nr:DUF6240 domain-containing protein [Lachnospiraceae bacterium]